MENQIHKSLIAINKKIEAIGKGRTNTQQGFKFRGIDDVMNELHSLFAENEVIILPCVKDIKCDERPTKSGGVLFYTHLTVDFTFIASDGSSVSTTAIGEAMDSGDKGTNKAMSIALKYVLLQMFLIPTEDSKDPDGETPELTIPKTTNAPTVQPKKEWLNPKTEKWAAAVKYLKDGGSITEIEAKYLISKTNREQLISEAV